MSVLQFSIIDLQIVVASRPLSCEHKGRRDLLLPLLYCHGVCEWDSASGLRLGHTGGSSPSIRQPASMSIITARHSQQRFAVPERFAVPGEACGEFCKYIC